MGRSKGELVEVVPRNARATVRFGGEDKPKQHEVRRRVSLLCPGLKDHRPIADPGEREEIIR